jgi:4-hydroxy-3-methylbut-2-enyl diphosphate reductase
MPESTYFRKGFGLGREIEPHLLADYNSRLVDHIRAQGHRLELDGLTFRLAKEFGFCYGVDRAVEYAYQTREKFPVARLFVVGEIIHNPHVNRRLEEKGIAILTRKVDGAFDFSAIRSTDVVILPAFGVTVRDFQRLREVGCILVDTTCGSVLNVWKRVEKYAQEGFTALVHGKYFHEETRATTSQVERFPSGKYLVVRDMAETEEVCSLIEGTGDPVAVSQQFHPAASAEFDFARDLQYVGIANQTTMLARESLAIAERVRAAFANRYGAEGVARRFRSFDTICSATQERQDAVLELLQAPLDIMVIIGGYNSSNTVSLARICSERVQTFHIDAASAIDSDAGCIRHQPIGTKSEVVHEGWFAADTRNIGFTAGASTPNNEIGEAIRRVIHTGGREIPPLEP